MRRICICFLTILIPFSVSAQLYWNNANLEYARVHLNEEPYQQAYISLIRKANKYLLEPNLSVVDDKEHVPDSGNIHDYMSIGRYTWPDSTKVDGLPYIGRDGYTNPEYYTYDREVLLNMVDRVKTFTLAWYFSRDRRYAAAAVKQIRIWFVKKDSYMNPNLYYAMIIKGYSKPNANGIHEGLAFVDMIDPLYLLENYRAIGWHRDLRKVRIWFNDYLSWIESSEQGVAVSKVKDNIGTSYELQRFAFSIFCERKEKAQEIMDSFVNNRINKQIDSNGVQVEEIKRQSSFGYSVSNISTMMNFITMAHNQGINLSHEAQLRFYKAVDYLIPYLEENNKWPYAEISDMQYYRRRLCFELYRIATYIDTSKQSYLSLYEQYGKMNSTNINNLLYIR